MEQGEFITKINGLRLWYKVSGKGPVCILPTPGWGPSAHYLETMQPLEAYYTMVYMETRGSGRSQPPSAMSEYTWDHFTADLEALRQHLRQEQIWLAGHSQGGMIVMHYAFTYPDQVKGMLVIDSAPGYDNEMLSDAIARAQQHGYGAILEREFDSQLVHPPATEAAFHQLLAESQPIFYWHDVTNAEKHAATFAAGNIAFRPWQGSAHSNQAAYDFVSRLPEIKAKTLIIVGISDVVCSVAQSERIHREIDNSKLLVIEEAGHFPWLEAPEAFYSGVRAFLPVMGYMLQ